MKRKRRHLTAEFKARVALEALEEEKTIQQIAIDEDVAPAQVSAWKKELQERIGELFEWKNAASESIKKSKAQTARLERKVGQLVIEKGIRVRVQILTKLTSATGHFRHKKGHGIYQETILTGCLELVVCAT